MIGDWLLWDKTLPCIVTTIGCDYIETTKCGITLAESHLLRPIPLTTEILEKNGFVKYNEVSDTPPYDKDEEGNMYYSFKGEHKFWGWWQPNNVYLIPVNAMIDLEIKYVHELQHALRLCGINKEITI